MPQVLDPKRGGETGIFGRNPMPEGGETAEDPWADATDFAGGSRKRSVWHTGTRNER